MTNQELTDMVIKQEEANTLVAEALEAAAEAIDKLVTKVLELEEKIDGNK